MPLLIYREGVREGVGGGYDNINSETREEQEKIMHIRIDTLPFVID